MQKLIEVSTLLEEIAHGKSKPEICDGAQEVDWMERCMENAPSIDAVPVVRCKDCRHSHKINDVLDFDGESSLYECSYATVPNRGWEFCSWGERREEK